MANNVLNIENEYARLSENSKKTWRDVRALIEDMYRSNLINAAQRNALYQRKMAALVYSDLADENLKYDGRTDIESLKRVHRNKLEMGRMNSIYADNAQIVERVEPILNQRIIELAQKISKRNAKN